jgi:hypothetical protein
MRQPVFCLLLHLRPIPLVRLPEQLFLFLPTIMERPRFPDLAEDLGAEIITQDLMVMELRKRQPRLLTKMANRWCTEKVLKQPKQASVRTAIIGCMTAADGV